MKGLIIILWFTGYYLSICQIASVIDSIKKEKVLTTWTDNGDYFISDFKADFGGVAKDYDGMLFYKYRYSGIFIDKKNGKVFQRIWQSLEGPRDQGGYPYNIHLGNWDLSPTDTSNIIVGEYEAYSGKECRVISYKKGTPDTLYKWINNTKDYHRNQNGYYDFNAISNTKFLTRYDALRIDQPYRVDKRETNFINLETNTITNFKRMNLSNVEFNNSKNRLITSTTNKAEYPDVGQQDDPNSYDFFHIENGICKQDLSLNIKDGSWFKYFLDDSLCLYKISDSLYLRDLNKQKVLAAYYLHSNVSIIGVYNDSSLNMANVVYNTQEGKRILSIHIPSTNVIMDKPAQLPYLGKPLAELEDGYQLSIGDNQYLYKHKNDVFNFDTISAEFNFKYAFDNNVYFSDLSYGAIKNWNWSFGDGFTSELRNPTHQFESHGDYTVTLSVTDENGLKSSSSKIIKVEDQLNAAFDFGKFSGNAPLSIEFQNYSTPNAKRFIWNFGDGTYSYEKEPTHIYTTSGTYTVSLTILDENENFHTYLSNKKVIVSD